MSTASPPPIVIADTWEQFDRLIEKATTVVEFESEAAEHACEAADWRLHLQICDVMGVVHGPTRSDNLVHVVEDWFPTRTKYVEADASAFGPDQVDGLRALLRGEFADWQINVQIYLGFDRDPPAHVGGVHIARTRTLVQRAALSYVQHAP